MIGQLFPFMIFAAATVGATFTTVNVRSTSTATEISNNTKWLVRH